MEAEVGVSNSSTIYLIIFSWSFSKERRPISLPEVQGEVLYGLYPVLMALQKGKRYLHRVFVKRNSHQNAMLKSILEAADAKNVEVLECGGSELDLLSHNRPHQVKNCEDLRYM